MNVAAWNEMRRKAGRLVVQVVRIGSRNVMAEVAALG